MDLFVVILYSIIVYQAVVFSCILYVSGIRQHLSSRRTLAILFLLLTIYFTFHLLNEFRQFDILVHIYLPILPVILLLNPVFFLYIESLTSPGFRFKMRKHVHFIPAAVILILNLPYYFATPEERLFFITRRFDAPEPAPLIKYLLLIYAVSIYLAFLIQFIFYSIKEFRLLKNHESFIRNNYSFTEKINLRWIRTLIIGFALFFVLNEMIWLSGMSGRPVALVFYNLSMIAVMLFLGLRGMSQLELKIPETTLDPVIQPVVGNFTETQPAKYKGSSLSGKLRSDLITGLERIMIEEKMFLNPRLSIDDVAERLGTNSKYISQVLNEHHQRNFYAYINAFRIEEAQRLLLSPAHRKYSILAIAEMSGFSSKSSFNEAFKAQTNQTPSGYRRTSEQLTMDN
ncbi:MAG TPA: helix-turn-helix domain-containing protein [Bacteroidales bacterium]|nr:helix-turn-helix domain-containing protein [Bacteroidales bacterium]